MIKQRITLMHVLNKRAVEYLIFVLQTKKLEMFTEEHVQRLHKIYSFKKLKKPLISELIMKY